MGFEIRTITADEITRFREALMQTFGADLDADPTSGERFPILVDLSQAWAAFDGSTIVGTAATFKDLQLGLPGGVSVPFAGLTMVTVRPTHRRRGILRELMQHHLDDARARGFAFSGLWASEATIYGRFGYGIAAEHHAIEIAETNTLSFRARDFDDLEWIEEARAREVLPGIYARATEHRPGALRRTQDWWKHRRFNEAPWSREGASLRRHVLAKRGGELTGYIAYRQRTGGSSWGKNEIIELHGVDARAEATLWRFILSLDLFREVKWSYAPVDDPLPLVINDARRVQRKTYDNVWLRIDDVPAALRARRYASDGVLRFTVDHAAFELVVEGGVAECSTTTQGAELAIERAALGSLYLGGFSATRLARAGQIRGGAGAIALADRVFASAVMPWCAEVF